MGVESVYAKLTYYPTKRRPASQQMPFAKTPKVIDDMVQYTIHLKRTYIWSMTIYYRDNSIWQLEFFTFQMS